MNASIASFVSTKPWVGEKCPICFGSLENPRDEKFNGRCVSSAESGPGFFRHRNDRAVSFIEPCRHLFHTRCIMEWIGESITCPLDRRPVYTAYRIAEERAGAFEVEALDLLELPQATLRDLLVSAAKDGCIDLVRKLLGRGVDADAGRVEPETPLDLAVRGRHVEVVLELAEYGARGPGAYFELGLLYRDGGEGVEQDYTQARKYFRKAAEKGHGSAANYLGVLYHDGLGVDQDYAEARKWYLQAIGQKNSQAYCNLGVLYHYVDQDYAKALDCYLRASRMGSEPACRYLSILYGETHGEGPEEFQLELSFKWLNQSLAMLNKTDNPDLYKSVQYEIGLKYEHGAGVKKDLLQAYDFYEESALLNDRNAQYKLGCGYRYEKEWVESDARQAKVWFEKSAQQGHPGAQFELGRMHHSGYGIPVNYPEAIQWYQKAAKQGHPDARTSLIALAEREHGEASNWLAGLYHDGLGVDHDYTEIRKRCLKAAAQDNMHAYCNLGSLCYWVDQDYTKARDWYLKAADKGSARACIYLGILYGEINGEGTAKHQLQQSFQWFERSLAMLDSTDELYKSVQYQIGLKYEDGAGVNKDLTKAHYCYRESARLKYKDAQYKLGYKYRYGDGLVTTDVRQAISWFEKSAQQGHQGAQYELGCMHQFGHGVPVNCFEALEWFHKAAEQGHQDAKANLIWLREWLSS